MENIFENTTEVSKERPKKIVVTGGTEGIGVGDSQFVNSRAFVHLLEWVRAGARG